MGTSLKDKTFYANPYITDDLKEAIQQQLFQVSTEILQVVLQNFVIRLWDII
jgi:hypothetical protein